MRDLSKRIKIWRNLSKKDKTQKTIKNEKFRESWRDKTYKKNLSVIQRINLKKK